MPEVGMAASNFNSLSSTYLMKGFSLDTCPPASRGNFVLWLVA